MLIPPFPLQRVKCGDHIVVADDDDDDALCKLWGMVHRQRMRINVMDDDNHVDGEGQGGGDNKE